MTQVCLNAPQWLWLGIAGLLCLMVGLYVGTWLSGKDQGG